MNERSTMNNERWMLNLIHDEWRWQCQWWYRQQGWSPSMSSVHSWQDHAGQSDSALKLLPPGHVKAAVKLALTGGNSSIGRMGRRVLHGFIYTFKSTYSYIHGEKQITCYSIFSHLFQAGFHDVRVCCFMSDLSRWLAARLWPSTMARAGSVLCEGTELCMATKDMGSQWHVIPSPKGSVGALKQQTERRSCIFFREVKQSTPELWLQFLKGAGGGRWGRCCFFEWIFRNKNPAVFFSRCRWNGVDSCVNLAQRFLCCKTLQEKRCSLMGESQRQGVGSRKQCFEKIAPKMLAWIFGGLECRV